MVEKSAVKDDRFHVNNFHKEHYELCFVVGCQFFVALGAVLYVTL